jgi:hypothetical protein
MSDCIGLDSLDFRKLATNKERFREFVYTSPSEAEDEIVRRWNDRKLKNRVETFLGRDIPGPLGGNYRAILFRQVFSPNHELLRFMKMADAIGLEPFFLEYHDDKFTSMNPIKHCLGKLRFYQDIGSGHAQRVASQRIIDFDASQGRKMKEVMTIWGQSLIDFHHELLESVVPNCGKYLFDASDWFHRSGGRAKDYYLRYIALYIRSGICFENFILEGDELRFVKEIFLPNFYNIWQIMGVKPLFVELLPASTEQDAYWMSYPIQMMRCMRNKMVVK